MPNGFTHLAPGTYIQEIDLSARVRQAITTTGGIVFASDKGPTGLTFTPNGEQFTRLYGKPNPKVSFGHDCALAFHTEASTLFNKRVTNGALYAGYTCFKDLSSKYAGADGRVLNFQFPVGSPTGYEAGGRELITLAFSAALITGNSFSMSITDGETLTIVGPVVFAVDNNTTVSNISAAISTALSSFGDDGYVTVHTEVNAANTDNTLIRILPPTGTSLLFGSAAVTLGASQAVATINTEAKLFDVFAENPGDWGNDIGTKITNVDVGVRQRYRITLGGALVTSNSFTCVVNGRTIGPVVFATDSDSTLAAIAAALTADVDIESATVQEVPGALNNDRAINIIAAGAAPGYLSISGASITLGASQAAVLVQETLKGQLPTNEFDFEVYSRSNTIIPLERYRCSLAKQVNAFGQQTAIDSRVNQKGTGSLNVRVLIPESARSFVFKPTLVGNAYVVDTTIRFLGNGDSGAAVLNSQVAAAWDSFKNREIIPVKLLINAGYTDPSVQQAMVALAEHRYDAFAILDMPSDKQDAQSAFNHRMQDMNIDSSYGAIYTPDLLVNDDDSDELRYIPPSGHVAAAYAYSDGVAAVWFAPAGLNRGKLRRVRGLRVNYEDGDRELLNPIGVNCIIDKPIVGPVIWGEETLQYKKSALSSVHVRRLMNYVEVAYADGLDYVALFEPNNPFTRINVVQVGEQFLDPIKRAGGFYDYEIVCDTRNNTDDVIDEDYMLVDMYVKPTRTAKRVLLRGILMRTGASFSETIELVNNQTL